MKRIKPIKPKPVQTPQCCVDFDPSCYGPGYNERRAEKCERLGWDVNKCGKPSTYEINGKFYCTQHAGQLALRMLMEESMEWDHRYRELREGEVIQADDESLESDHPWHGGNERWERVPPHMVGRKASDPRCPAHSVYRRRMEVMETPYRIEILPGQRAAALGRAGERANNTKGDDDGQ